MLAEEIKAKVQAAYKKAISCNVQTIRDSSLPAQFRDLTLYGNEAGVDLIETHLDLIVREAVGAAECRQTMLSLPLYGCGRAAIEGVAAALRDLTGLKIEVQQSLVKVIWAVSDPGLV